MKQWSSAERGRAGASLRAAGQPASPLPPHRLETVPWCVKGTWPGSKQGRRRLRLPATEGPSAALAARKRQPHPLAGLCPARHTLSASRPSKKRPPTPTQSRRLPPQGPIHAQTAGTSAPRWPAPPQPAPTRLQHHSPAQCPPPHSLTCIQHILQQRGIVVRQVAPPARMHMRI